MKKLFIILSFLFSITATSANAVEVSLEAKITGFYVAYFNRAADQSGLNWWITKAKAAQNEGGTVEEVLKELSAGFAQHPTFISTYAHLSNQSFVETIYRNALGRDGDTEGIDWWTERLDNGLSRSDMVAEFVTGSLVVDLIPENFPTLTADELAQAQLRQDLITNKVNAALAFTNTLGELTNVVDALNPEDDPAYLASIKIISEVTEDVETVFDVIAFLDSIINSSDPISDILEAENIISGLNIPPTADAGVDQSADINQILIITGSATDIDGSIISYEWTKDDMIIATTNSFEYIPTVVGTDTLTLTVMDNDGATASDSMNVIVSDVSPINQAPIADAASNQEVFVSDTVTLDGSASRDPDGDPLTYTWTFISKPVGSNATLLNSTSIYPTFIADKAGTYEIQLTVNDGYQTNSDNTIVSAITSSTTVSFTGDVMPIFAANCMSCHTTSSKRIFKVGDATYTYNNIMTNGLINTTSPDLSAILIKGNGGSSHSGGDQLSSTSSNIIENWIKEGGLYN